MQGCKFEPKPFLFKKHPNWFKRYKPLKTDIQFIGDIEKQRKSK